MQVGIFILGKKCYLCSRQPERQRNGGLTYSSHHYINFYFSYKLEELYNRDFKEFWVYGYAQVDRVFESVGIYISIWPDNVLDKPLPGKT